MPRPSRAEKRREIQIQVIAGAGLIVLGIALLALFRAGTPAATTSTATPVEESVIPLPVSYPEPELTLTDTHGEDDSLSNYRGDVLLVNNWATWCPPCKAEMPTLEAYYEAHAHDGFMIVAVEAGESRSEVVSFAQAYQLKFPVWLDPGNQSVKAFRNSNLPNSFVIDRAGVVRFAWTGPISRAMLEQYVTPLIAQSN